jgi:hypothetical protein
MDKDDEVYFNELIKQYNKDINKISERIKQIWRETVQEDVYDIYDPKYYADKHGNRTNQLKDKVTSKLENGILYVYADTEDMNYYSFGDKDKPVNAEAVVHFVDVGHNYGDSPFPNDYDNFYHYEGRRFIEKFAERVKQEYPEYEIQVFRDTPPIV